MGETNNDQEGEDVVQERQWKFTQWFRKMQQDQQQNQAQGANNQRAPQEIKHEANYISAVEFDDTGDYLVTGDKSGNVVILKNDPEKATEKDEPTHYSFFSEFQSHFLEFDFVRSQQVGESINKIQWGPQTNDSLFLLVTNDRQIKLWKVSERETFRYVSWNALKAEAPIGLSKKKKAKKLDPEKAREEMRKNLRLPKVIKEPISSIALLRKAYFTDSHPYPVTHLCASPDKQNFISGDTLKIHLWDLYKEKECYNVLDITPENMAELSEIISTVHYHPRYNHMFMYGTNLGKLNVCDMRVKALGNQPSLIFDSLRKKPTPVVYDSQGNVALDENGVPIETFQEEDTTTLFDEVTSGVSHAVFSPGGRFILSRDYMSVKLWDMNYQKKPVETFYVHEFLREKLFDLYRNEFLWDGFGVGLSKEGNIVTGSYSNYFHIFDLAKGEDIFFEAARAPMKYSDLELHQKKRRVNYTHPPEEEDLGNKKKGGFMKSLFGGSKKKPQPEEPATPTDSYPLKFKFDTLDLNKKMLNTVWHPQHNTIAVAGQNNLFVYSK